MQFPITQYIRCGLTPLPIGTLLPSVATSYMLETLDEMEIFENFDFSDTSLELMDRFCPGQNLHKKKAAKNP